MHDDGVPFIQHDYEKSRARHDQEVKLIISAWYNMVSERVNTQAQTGTTSTPPNPSLLHLSLSSALFTCQGMGLHQKVSGERLGSSNQAMSFLAQQRQLTNARRGLTRHHPRWDTEAWQLPSNEKQSAHKVIHVISECLLPFLCLHWDHCASVLSRCCCPLLALTDMRRFLFSVGLQSRSSLLWLKSRSYRP